MKRIEILDFVNSDHPHLLMVVEGDSYRRFFTEHDLDLARHLANELMKWVISTTERSEGL